MEREKRLDNMKSNKQSRFVTSGHNCTKQQNSEESWFFFFIFYFLFACRFPLAVLMVSKTRISTLKCDTITLIRVARKPEKKLCVSNNRLDEKSSESCNSLGDTSHSCCYAKLSVLHTGSVRAYAYADYVSSSAPIYLTRLLQKVESTVSSEAERKTALPCIIPN